jgi:hypothetical protein
MAEGKATFETQARELGAEHGTNAGSWVIDGDTPESTIRQILGMIEDGDPMFEIPSPLSGEWADEPTTDTVADALGVGEAYRNGHVDLSDAFDAYEEAYYEAYQDEVVRSGHAMLPDDES